MLLKNICESENKEFDRYVEWYGESSMYFNEYYRQVNGITKLDDIIYVSAMPNILGKKYIVISEFNIEDLANPNPIGEKYKDERYCRLSMLEPRYIGYQDESLRLNKEQIDKLYDILTETNTDLYLKSTGKNIPDLTRWQYIIDYNNTIETWLKTSQNFFVPMPMDLPIPDYYQLMK